MLKNVRFGFSGLVIIFLLTSAVSPCFGAGPASRPRLAVFAFGNETGSAVYDAVCASAGRSLALTLHQLALYDLQTVPRLVGRTEEALRVAALEQRADYLMFGSISSAGGKSLVFRLGLYDRAKGTTSILRESKPVSSLDLFEAVDEVILSTLSGITGGHIGFGSVELVNGGEKGAYQVFLDGMVAGDDLTELGRVLSGPHTITVVQRRMLGEVEIARKSLEVAEGGSYECAFKVPYLTEAEKAKVEGLQASIRAEWQSPTAAASVEKHVAALVGLLRDVSYSPRLSGYQDSARQLEAEWKILKNRFAIEEKAWAPDSALLDRSIVIYLTAEDYPDPAALRKGVEENAILLATLLELDAGKTIAAGDYDAGVALIESILDFSRYLGADRKAEYAMAIATLRDLFARRAVDPTKFEQDLQTVFGDQISAGKKLAGLEAEAKRSARAVFLSSDAGATVSVGGAQSAPLPLLLPAAGVRVSIEVSRDGQTAAAEELDVPAGRRVVFVAGGFQAFGRARAAVAGPATAPLRFRNVPDGYTVYVDDVKIGVTPLGQVMVKEGRVEIRFERPGEEPKYQTVDTSASRVETLEWGLLPTFPIQLVRRSISLKGEEEDWKGLEPILEGTFTGGGFFANKDWAIKRVYLCRDHRYLYWRVDFAKDNPFYKIPKGIGKRYTIELSIKPAYTRWFNLGINRRRDKSELESYMGIWDQAKNQWSHLGSDRVAFKQSPGFAEFRVALNFIDSNVKGVLPAMMRMMNYPDGERWEPGPIETPGRYIDFGE